MKVTVKDLGILKQAEFDVGDLTIICGANNTGKTYATYALYGFLVFWNEAFTHYFIDNDVLKQLVNQGSVRVAIDEITKSVESILNNSCGVYSGSLQMVLGANEKYTSNSYFRITMDNIDFSKIDKKIQTKGPSGRPLCEIYKICDESFVTIKITTNAEEVKEINKEWFLHQINHDIKDILFGSFLPDPFIASIERTGAAMFQKELDFSRNRLLEHVSNRDKDIDPIALIGAYYDGRYALPVKRDVDFIRDLENVVKYKSEIAQNNPDILKTFDLLSGGEYKATREGIYYVPNKSSVKLTMGESASSVRSLLNVGMYIRHIACPGDFVMIDEPELNLHPMNQCLMARLLAKLVNSGIRVFITTHSDYILKEFNTLIMMKNAGSSANHVMEKYRYEENELLDASKVKAYIAKKELVKIDGFPKRQRHYTFVQAPIDNQGIEIAIFDETINKMNEIQEELLYSGDI